METTVLEPIPRKAPQLIPFQFKGESAKSNSIKAVAARQAKRANRKAGIPVDPVETLTQAYECSELSAMRAEITNTRKQLRDEPDADLRFKLGCLLKKLWEIEQLLSNRPGPGTRKPAPERKGSASGRDAEPLDD